MTTMRRVLAALTALVLAVFGTVVLVAYVHGADARAAAGATLVPVLVVKAGADVPAGTSADALADSVSTVQVPQRLKANDALSDLSQIAGLSTTVGLLAGDQLRSARFADPAVQAAADGATAVPAGLEEVSVSLEPQRVVGGVLVPGDRVGVYITQVGTDPSAVGPAATDLAVSQVLVTSVSSGGATVDLAGTGTTVTVTLALSQADARTVINGMELKKVWLSLQSAAVPADTSGDTATTTGAQQ
jgi:pilus assembly protein CpaB